ncbi:MAG: hypothetical protein PWP54_1402 [Thermosipho sp. (in: thermotogales)]|nr:hypothetical protein [Thermosipho sp. (in: thermotogales)]MDK2900131.1 hypothetical protein [Thermosipho sp. (in: thermotogales)]
MSNNKPLVAIIILNYNQSILVDKLVNNLNDQTYRNYIIFIVDNSENQKEIYNLNQIRKNSKNKIEIIINQRNVGYSKGNNIGIKSSEKFNPKYILILNPDVYIEDKNFIKTLVDFAEKNTHFEFIGPKVFDKNGNLLRIYFKDENSLFNILTGNFFELLSFKLKKTKLKKKSKGYSFVYRIYGCCMFVKMETIRKIDYFDENVFLYEEESILSEKLKRINQKPIYLFDTYIYHIHPTEKHILKKLKKINVAMKSKIYLLKEYKKYPKIIAIILGNIWRFYRYIFAIMKL